ncbi:MAG: hypothetical protein QW751_00810 [Candidatus Aenigmatarchaeota archaeon]|nr:hypothetical protein [Candidatus Aenigmarchaeota archaeon]
MKGFVYLIEVAIAGLLTVLALAALISTTTLRAGWERPDLIALGDSVMWSLEASNQMINVLNGNASNITRMLPFNIRWALHVSGTPKSEIRVGCVCDFKNYTLVKDMLELTYINGRPINFTVDQLSWPTMNANDYDVIIFTTPVAFDTDNDVKNYLSLGRGIIALFNMDASALSNMTNTFGLRAQTRPIPPSGYINFTEYNPTVNRIPKYFFGFGMPVTTTYAIGDGKVSGTWKLWGVDRQVNVTPSMRVEIEGAVPSSVVEGGGFVMTGPSGNVNFKIKKIWPDSSGVIFQPLVPDFDFLNFANDDTTVTGNINIVSDGVISAVTANGTAVWISDWPVLSSEYGLLLRAAVASLATDWWVVEAVNPREPVTTTAFASLSGDTPETVKLVLWLWYVF